MNLNLAIHPRRLVVILGAAALLALPAIARGQGDLIGQRGGQTTPTVPAVTTPTTPPVLPSTLSLPPTATNSLLNGLNASGTATRHGMGWIVSDMAHQGIHGQQLSDAIHQLKPFMHQGVLQFPQSGQTVTQPHLPFQQQGIGQGIMQNIGRGRGKGR